tara:strand:+ start:1164 stop:1382 length:219 start_codon:yes stop_codon:yes gene_type:complete
MKIIHFPKCTGLAPRQADSFDFAALKLYRLELGKQREKLTAYENELRLSGWTVDEIDHGRACGRILSSCNII